MYPLTFASPFIYANNEAKLVLACGLAEYRDNE